MNEKMDVNMHYNANESRQLLTIIKDIETVISNLKNSKYDFLVNDEYLKTFKIVKDFLCCNGGSTIPNNMSKIKIRRYEQIFQKKDLIAILPERVSNKKMIGEGAFARVFSYKDLFLNEKFCIKELKLDMCKDKDIIRFEKEFQYMHELNSPYIVKAYKMLDNKTYIMEYCDYTLKNYINKYNSVLKPSERKRMCLQFLNALKFLYQNKILHRDLSLNNVLIKQYDDVVIVKTV